MRGFQNKARQYALKLLSYRGRSERELEDRLLKKGITKSEASSTIEYFKEIGLIDDKSFAETLKREALNTKMLSRKAAKRYMLDRGLSHEIVDNVSFDPEDTDLDNAGRLVERRLRALEHYSPEIAKRRLYSFLLRRGYSSEIITRVLRDKIVKEED